MKAYNIKTTENNDKLDLILTINKTDSNYKRIAKLTELIDKEKILKVDIKEYRKKRSLDANSYCWVLSQKIAEVIGNTKEFVYMKAIRDKGQFEIVPIRKDVVGRWIKNWESKGLGWQSEVLGKSKIKGYTNTINYFGSSVYNSKEMALVLEEIVFQAKELDIDTITPQEKENLIKQWEDIK